MQWIKARIETRTEGTELVFGVLLSCGINGAQIIDANDLQNILNAELPHWDYVDETLAASYDENAYVEFYVTPDFAGKEILNQIQTQLLSLHQTDIGIPLGSLSLTSELLDDATWLNGWKKYYKPFRIGKNIVIVPIWEEYAKDANDIVFTIDPGSVFGTGLHQSTQLCIEAMEKHIKSKDTMLDVGCGSGILSIIGLLLGTDSVLACDFDPAAEIATRENIRFNPVNPSKITVITGDIFTDEALNNEVSNHKFDIITVNIVADAIIKLAPLVKPFLKPGGLVISSGIINERVNEVIKTFKENDYAILENLSRDGWHGLVCKNA